MLGGSAVALFFLVVDLMEGRPLFTPSLLGSVLFFGAAAEDVTTVSPTAVAYFSLAHIVIFTAIGAAASWLVHEVELHSRHPIAVLLLLFALIEGLAFIFAPVLLSGVIETLGVLRVASANLLAAGAMALYFVLAHREGAWHELKHTTRELMFDSLYCGVLGGSAIALFFLIGDALHGQPLFTPSLMGSVLFLGAAAEDVVTVSPAAIAYFSIAHIVTFTLLGAGVVWLFHEVELHSRHPLAVLFVLFAIIEVGFFFVASLALPGVIERLGIVRVGVANLVGAATMALYLAIAHREGAWQKLKHTTSELMLDSLYCGVFGGSVFALFFLVVDFMDGRPLFTPSLLGSVLFFGAAAEDVATVDLGAVAYFSIAHIVTFTAVGAAIVWLFHEVELHARHPLLVLLVLFAIIEVSFYFVASLALPGVIKSLGGGRLAAANLLAASAMALYLVAAHREGAWHHIKHTSADLLYDSFYASALGGSAVALFFLVADVVEGQPLFTPSLMGSVLFYGAAAKDVVEVRLDAVAYMSIVHFVAAGVLGTAMSWLVHEVELHARHPFVVLLVLFAIIEVSFFFIVSLTMPGVIGRLGVVRIGIANLLAAATMAAFFVFSHREDAWEKLKQTARLA